MLTKPLGISLRQLALRLGRDKGGLSRAARDGRIPRLVDGTFDENAVRAALDKEASGGRDEALTDPVDETPNGRTFVNAIDPHVPPVETASLVRQVLAEEGQEIGSDTLTLTHVRMAVGILKAREQAVEIARTRGELVEIEVVGQAVEAEYAVVRANLTAMPGDVAPDLEGLRAAEIEERLAAKVAEILNGLVADDTFATA